MTDIETLIQSRIRQADETLADAETLFNAHSNARSIVNRTYYAIFYAMNALLLKENISIQTSKHMGIIALFNKELIHKGKIDKKYSVVIHHQFEMRQKGDYKALVEISTDEAKESIREAKEFLDVIKENIVL